MSLVNLLHDKHGDSLSGCYRLSLFSEFNILLGMYSIVSAKCHTSTIN